LYDLKKRKAFFPIPDATTLPNPHYIDTNSLIQMKDQVEAEFRRLAQEQLDHEHSYSDQLSLLERMANDAASTAFVRGWAGDIAPPVYTARS